MATNLRNAAVLHVVFLPSFSIYQFNFSDHFLKNSKTFDIKNILLTSSFTCVITIVSIIVTAIVALC